MRAQFLQSFDFNQTLVFSVFGHLLIMTAVLFLPKPAFLEKTIVPAFRVNLVSEPAGFITAQNKGLEPSIKTKKPKAKKKPKVKKKSKAKMKHAQKKTAANKSPAPKPSAVKKLPAIKTPNIALDALNKLEGKVALAIPNMVAELDQIARLENTRIKASPAKATKQKPIDEKTFRELEKLRKKKVTEKKTVAPVPRHKDVLENFEELKMKENLSKIPTSLEKQQEPVPESKELEKTKTPEMDLLKELELLAKLDALPVLVPDAEEEEQESLENTQSDSESYAPIIEKLDSFSLDSEPVKVEISRTYIDSSHFQSKLRNLPKASLSTADPEPTDSFVMSKNVGNPGADAQSLHVGMIQEKVYQKWREPLAQEHNREVVVSFFIFSQGNIDKPFVKKSSGVKALDTLAVRAVLDAAPFPEFPKELKIPNFRIEMYFKYVPKDK
jgi:TonB family protein